MLNWIRIYGRAVVVAIFAITLIAVGGIASAAPPKSVWTLADGLPSNWVTALAPADGGKVWVGTGNAGFFLFDPAKGVEKAYSSKDGLVSNDVVSVAVFKGKLFIGTAGGLSILDGGKFTNLDKVAPEQIRMRNVRLAASPDGKSLWAAAVDLSGGTVKTNDGVSWAFVGGRGMGLFNEVQGFAFRGDEVLMAGGTGTPYIVKGDSVTPFGEKLPPSQLFTATATEKGWVVGASTGLFMNEGKGWMPLPVPPGMEGKPVLSLAVSGEVVYAGTKAGLLRLSGGKSSLYDGALGIPAGRVTTVLPMGKIVFVGTANGLAVLLVP